MIHALLIIASILAFILKSLVIIAGTAFWLLVLIVIVNELLQARWK